MVAPAVVGVVPGVLGILLVAVKVGFTSMFPGDSWVIPGTRVAIDATVVRGLSMVCLAGVLAGLTIIGIGHLVALATEGVVTEGLVVAGCAGMGCFDWLVFLASPFGSIAFGLAALGPALSLALEGVDLC